MVTGMPVYKFVCKGLAILMGCIMLSACNTSNFEGGVSSRVPTQNVGSNDPALIQNPDQDQVIGETALVENQTDSLIPLSDANLQPIQSPNADTQLASLPTGPGISFLPVTGAPQRSVTALSKSLQSAAQSNQVNLLSAGSSNAKYRVKGYFSALDDGSGTLLVYVWDVLDKAGTRKHRISGQKHTSKKSADPWAAVSEGEISSVANDTMTRLGSWLAKN